MGKKFCYLELRTANQAEPRVENRRNYRQGSRNCPLEKDQDAREEKDEGDEPIARPPQSMFS